MFVSIIWNMYNKEEAFLLWFPPHSMNMRVGNALFPLVVFTRNFCLQEIRTDEDYRGFNEFFFTIRI